MNVLNLVRWLAGKCLHFVLAVTCHCCSFFFFLFKWFENQNFVQGPSHFHNVYLCSFDITSLFPNVPLTDTVKICSSTLYEDLTTLTKPPIPQEVFVELIKYVEYSFNNKMYGQIDGVAMGSHLVQPC